MSSDNPPLPASGTFEVTAGERTFNITLDDGVLNVDGSPASYSFDRIDEQYYLLRLEGAPFPIVIEDAPQAGVFYTTVHGRRTKVEVKDEKDLLLEKYGMDEGPGAGEREIRSPMPGLVLNLLVEPGQDVAAGDGLLVLEAMKMENELRAPVDGTVHTIYVDEGDAVDKDALLVELE